MQRHSRIVKIFDDANEHAEFLKWMEAPPNQSYHLQRVMQITQSEEKHRETRNKMNRHGKLKRFTGYAKAKAIETKEEHYEDKTDNLNTKTFH